MVLNPNFKLLGEELIRKRLGVGWETICFLLLFFISILTIFFQLGARSLENQCYIRYAEVAREMIRSGDWIVPRLEGKLFLHKPPLIIWLIALPSALVGKVTPFFARLPSALSAVAVIALTFYLGKRMFRDFRVGAIAGLILLSSKEFFWQARTARADMVLTLFILFSLSCFYIAYQSSDRKRFGFFLLFFVGLALSALTKGPVIIFPLGIVALFLLFNRRLRVFLEPGFWWGWIVFLFLILAWVIPYLSRVEISTLKAEFALTHILSRPEPFYYYLIEFWPRFAPWSLFLPAAVLFFFKKNPEQQEERLFLLCWVGVILILIFLVHNKTYRYFLPIFPAYSLILSASLKENLLSFPFSKKEWLSRAWEYATWVCFFIYIFSFLLAWFFVWWFTRSFTATLVTVFVSIGGWGLIGYALLKRELRTKIIVLSFLSLLIFETYFYFITREDDKHSPVKKIAEIIKFQVKPAVFYTFGVNGEEAILLDFYLDSEVLKLENSSQVVKALKETAKPSAILISQKGFEQVFGKLPPKTLAVFPITHYKKTTYFLITSKKK